MKLGIHIVVFLLVFVFSSGFTKDLSAQSLSVLRDSEIETILRAWAAPLLASADLDPDAVSIRLVNDMRLNAFVAGGQNIFLNSGLLMATEDPLQVIGVVAHEIGHISGGHLARSDEASQQAKTVALLHTILGIGAAAVAETTGYMPPNKAANEMALRVGRALKNTAEQQKRSANRKRYNILKPFDATTNTIIEINIIK